MRELIDVQSEAIGALFGFIGAEVGLICILDGSINGVGVRSISTGVESIDALVGAIGAIVGRLLVELDRLRH